MSRIQETGKCIRKSDKYVDEHTNKEAHTERIRKPKGTDGRGDVRGCDSVENKEGLRASQAAPPPAAGRRCWGTHGAGPAAARGVAAATPCFEVRGAAPMGTKGWGGVPVWPN